MLADVLINESEDEISSRLARYEVRFSNRYTEKDDGYKTCVQKAARYDSCQMCQCCVNLYLVPSRHNQVPVIDYDKRHTRRCGFMYVVGVCVYVCVCVCVCVWLGVCVVGVCACVCVCIFVCAYVYVLVSVCVCVL